MNKHSKKYLDRVDCDVDQAVIEGRVCGRPFAEYTNTAAAMFGGIDTIIKLLRLDFAERCESDEQEAERVMESVDVDSLLSLIGAVSDVMECRAGDLADWARERMQELEAKQ